MTACSAARRAFFWTRFETNITMALPTARVADEFDESHARLARFHSRTPLFAGELAYQRAPLREAGREESPRAEVATISHALRASRLSGTREGGEAESTPVVRARRASTPPRGASASDLR
jgi:hypothetical protein